MISNGLVYAVELVECGTRVDGERGNRVALLFLEETKTI